MIIGAEKVLPEGSEYPDMSLLSLVADTIMVCSNTNDWDWQVMSPLMISGLFPHKDYVSGGRRLGAAGANGIAIAKTVFLRSVGSDGPAFFVARDPERKMGRHHIVASLSPTAGAMLYVDGNLAAFDGAMK